MSEHAPRFSTCPLLNAYLREVADYITRVSDGPPGTSITLELAQDEQDFWEGVQRCAGSEGKPAPFVTERRVEWCRRYAKSLLLERANAAFEIEGWANEEEPTVAQVAEQALILLTEKKFIGARDASQRNLVKLIAVRSLARSFPHLTQDHPAAVGHQFHQFLQQADVSALDLIRVGDRLLQVRSEVDPNDRLR